VLLLWLITKQVETQKPLSPPPANPKRPDLNASSATIARLLFALAGNKFCTQSIAYPNPTWPGLAWNTVSGSLQPTLASQLIIGTALLHKEQPTHHSLLELLCLSIGLVHRCKVAARISSAPLSDNLELILLR